MTLLLRWAVVVLLSSAVFGCASSPVRIDKSAVTRQTLIDAQNARTANLDRLWARTSVQVTGRSDEGKRLREQAEGHLQIVQPEELALSLGKVGQVQLYLGSNDQVYWWMDMVDNDRKVALYGRHERATLNKAEALGVPVLPRDLVHLLGITPIDPGAAVGDVRWKKHLAGVEVRMDDGSRRMWFDPTTMEPARVELLDAGGRLRVAAELDRYDYVNVIGNALAKPRVPERIRVRLEDGTLIQMSLYQPENRSIRSIAFDFDRLVQGYHIDVLYDLDAPPPPKTNADGQAP